MMIWRACMKILPTGDKFSPSSNCFVCLTNHETPLHLFARCNLASALWFSGPIPVRIDRIPGDDLSTLLCNLVSSLDPMMRARMLVYAGVIMDCIWKHRNQIVHSNGAFQGVDSIRLNVCRRFANLDPAVEQVEQHPRSCPPIEPPRVATDKCILVDGSFLKGNYGCAMISVSKNSQDWWISVSAGTCQLALEAEMSAVRLGLQWAIKNQWDNFSILTDSRVLVEALAAKQPPHWKTAALFSDILHLLSLFSTCHGVGIYGSEAGEIIRITSFHSQFFILIPHHHSLISLSLPLSPSSLSDSLSSNGGARSPARLRRLISPISSFISGDIYNWRVTMQSSEAFSNMAMLATSQSRVNKRIKASRVLPV
ncbi:hypothetical protein G4B88_027430 [Cannabis sativa]|uniref:RNase H type-1 domain-containing protein n=1 Tax=Cannabis sativa TaxID=3483 RepID=A0A7J6HTJ9_CANSA|nr:hypothetical protein G4B88_027430 [Cannabis sativa]